MHKYCECRYDSVGYMYHRQRKNGSYRFLKLTLRDNDLFVNKFLSQPSKLSFILFDIYLVGQRSFQMRISAFFDTLTHISDSSQKH